MRVETYGARELLRKQILREKHDADVSMVRTFGKEIGHRLVRLMHEVVDREKHRIATVELVCVRQTATKLDVWILTEQLLLLSVTVDYLVRRRIYHDARIIYHSKDEPRLATTHGSGNQSVTRMCERQHYDVTLPISRIDAYLYVFFTSPPSLTPSLPPNPLRGLGGGGGAGRGVGARRFAVRFRCSARLLARSSESTHYASASDTEFQHHANDCRHQHPDGLCHHCLATVVTAYWRVVSCVGSSVDS